VNYHDLPPASSPLADPSKTSYATTSESALIVAPRRSKRWACELLLFTGDNEVMANTVGIETGVDGIQAETPPE
jgi:hypothetical protein